MKEKVAIVGAGVGGLATAARLAKKGYDVEVYEKLSESGGRAHMIEDRGFKFDTGPSFVMMPDFFREVFEYCGKDIKDYLNLRALDIHYKIFYPNAKTFTVFRDVEKTREELEKIEKGGAKAYDNFLKETKNIYKAVEPLLYKSFTPKSIFNPYYWNLIPKMQINRTYWQLAKKYFKSRELCYAFTFEAMFIGVSPFRSPAFYSIIAYTDYAHKIWHSMGGMYEIPKSLERLATNFGAKLNFNHEIDSITSNGNSFLLKNSFNSIKADKVVVNADYIYAKRKLLNRKIPKYDYSCSVYLIYWGLKKKVPGLEHHNLFFAENLKDNLDNIFSLGAIKKDFSFYIHVPTVTDPSLAPENKEILYILVPVPNLKNLKGDFAAYEEMIKRVVIDKINSVCGINLEEFIEVEHKFYPQDFIGRYNIEHGATFGLAHTLMQSAFFRPANRDSRMSELYFVGASTQPGGGLPPVLASSRIVADLITNPAD